MTRTIWLALALCLAIPMTGCGKKEPPSCEKVVEHLGTLMKSPMSDDFKSGAVKRCEHAPPETRQCALEAPSAFEVGACYNKKS